MVYSEEITLAGPAGAEAHFGALVRALQVAGRADRDVLDGPGAARVAAGARAAAGDRPAGVDTDRLPAARSSCSTSSGWRRAAQPLPVADLGWLRLGALRAAVRGAVRSAGGRRAAACSAARVTIRHRAGSDASALLLARLAGVLLGWRPLRSAQTSDGGAALRLRRAPAAAGRRLTWFPADGACGRSGILGIELTSGRGDRYAIRRDGARPGRAAARPGVPARAGQAGFTTRTPSWRRRARVARAAIRCSRAASSYARAALVARARHRGR